MDIAKNINIVEINYENYPVISKFKNWYGNITVPANSVMFIQQQDSQGNDIYEFASMDYVVPNEKDACLESTELLDEKIELSNQIERKRDNRVRRVVHLTQFYRNSVTGQPYFCDYEYFKNVMNKMDSIEHTVICIHDRDIYTQKDVERHKDILTKQYYAEHQDVHMDIDEYIQRYQYVFAGNQKPPHIHIPLRGKKGIDGKHINLKIDSLSRWFQCPAECFKFHYENEFKIEGQRTGIKNDGYLDAIQYLTHNTQKAQEEGKTIYPDSVVDCDFDWKMAIEKREQIKTAKIAKHEEYHMSQDTINDLIEDVKNEGIRLDEIKSQLKGNLYTKNRNAFEDAREMYIKNKAPIPTYRECIYIDAPSKNKFNDGDSGVGKTSCAKLMCMMLAQRFGADITKGFDQLVNEGYIYILAQGGASIKSYDQQPIIYVDEITGHNMLSAFRTKEGIKMFLSSDVTKQEFRTLYGAKIILAQYIVMNGIQPFGRFIAEIANGKENGKIRYDNQEQYYRRIMTNISIIGHQEFELHINKETVMLQKFQNEDRYDSMSIVGNFAEIYYGLNPEQAIEVMQRLLCPFNEALDQIEERVHNQKKNAEEILKKYEHMHIKPIKCELVSDNVIGRVWNETADRWETETHIEGARFQEVKQPDNVLIEEYNKSMIERRMELTCLRKEFNDLAKEKNSDKSSCGRDPYYIYSDIQRLEKCLENAQQLKKEKQIKAACDCLKNWGKREVDDIDWLIDRSFE